MVLSNRIRVILPVVLAGLLGQGCQESIEFTRRPGEDPVAGKQPAVRTQVYLASPVDAAGVQERIESQLPARAAKFSARIKKAACYEKNGRKRCRSARVTGEINRDGVARLLGNGREVHVVVPLHYTLTAKGAGAASRVSDTISGKLTVSGVYQLSLDKNMKPRVRFTKSYRWSSKPRIPVLSGELSLESFVTRRLGRYFRRFASSIENALDTEPTVKLLEEAWQNLYYPIRVSDEPAIWIRGEPSKVFFAGLGGDANDMSLRFGVTTRLKTYHKERPMPLIPLSLPKLAEDAPEGIESRVLMPLMIKYDRLAERLGEALPKGKVTIADNVEKAPVVEITGHKMFSAGGRLAMSIDLKADVPGAWRSMFGTAYLVGTPRTAEGQKRMRLANVGFTEATPTPSLFDDGRFLIPEAPFAKAFGTALDVDLSDSISRALRDANRWTGRKFTDNLVIGGRFDGAEVHSIEAKPEGLLVNLNLIGDLAISADLPVEGEGSMLTTASTKAAH